MAPLSNLFGRGRPKAVQSPSAGDHDPLVMVPMPPLVAVLSLREKEKGSQLTEAEVLKTAQTAPRIPLPRSQATALEVGRGYRDLDPERVWEEWRAFRDSA